MNFLIKTVQKGAEWICGILFLAMFGAFLIQIFMRYVMDNPMGWTDELSVLLFIWSVFLANAFLLRDSEQISFDLIYSRFSYKSKRFVSIFTSFIFVLAIFIAFPVFIDYLDFLKIQKTPLLLIPCNIVYSCFVLYVSIACIKHIYKIIKLFGKNWKSIIRDNNL